MTEETADEVYARYPYVSRAQALKLDALRKRYAPLLAANREKARLRRREELEETRRRIFDQG